MGVRRVRRGRKEEREGESGGEKVAYGFPSYLLLG